MNHKKKSMLMTKIIDLEEGGDNRKEKYKI